MRRVLAFGVVVFVVGFAVDAVRSGPAEPRRRGLDTTTQDGAAQDGAAPAPDGDTGVAREDEPGARRARRPLEAAPGGGAGRTERELHIALTRPEGCPLVGYARLAETLLGLENASEVMSLEVWGDHAEYTPYQTVIYHLRVPRPAWVTLFWLGPDGGIYVPFHNLRVPAHRDVTVDAASVVVPPLGRERWVALASLEPLVNPCFAGEAALLEAIARLRATPHGVGRWEVVSRHRRTSPAPAAPDYR